MDGIQHLEGFDANQNTVAFFNSSGLVAGKNQWTLMFESQRDVRLFFAGDKMNLMPSFK
ncbi:hypothetical protein D515_00220 [Grimontia indica]|uniref:Uncharacterized protein n=1 Tax=Grimontia indica TaxID=1056512 RepID=R1GX91_9GAMM|nr:hypothetical protein D515_00220 [Grimontia indica]